jgi:hypothetical protein
LPHGTLELASLDLLPELDRVAMRTRKLRYLTHIRQEQYHPIAEGHTGELALARSVAEVALQAYAQDCLAQ